MTADDLIAFRKAAGLTQAELGDLLDMTGRAIRDIENGRAKLRQVHTMAVERLMLRVTAHGGNLSLLPKALLRDVHLIAAATKMPTDAELSEAA